MGGVKSINYGIDPMPKLTVWIAECNDSSHAFDIRATTKKDCVRQLAEVNNPSAYDAPQKVVLQYDNAFDLFNTVSGESRHYPLIIN